MCLEIQPLTLVGLDVVVQGGAEEEGGQWAGQGGHPAQQALVQGDGVGWGGNHAESGAHKPLRRMTEYTE